MMNFKGSYSLQRVYGMILNSFLSSAIAHRSYSMCQVYLGSADLVRNILEQELSNLDCQKIDLKNAQYHRWILILENH